MARRRKGPWRRKQDQCWYTTVPGTNKVVKLAPADASYEDACRLYHAYHVSQQGRTEAGPLLTVSQLIDEYLEWTKQNRSPRTFRWYRDYLIRFHKFHGDRLRVSDLKPYHVSQWLQAEYKGQSDSHRKGAIRSIKRVMNWAMDLGYITTNPIERLQAPAPRPRETTITESQFQQALALYPAGRSLPGLSPVPLGDGLSGARDSRDRGPALRWREADPQTN